MIKEIDFLVHPFFMVADSVHARRRKDELPSELTKKEKAFMKKWSGVWGKLVQEAKKNPEKVFVVGKEWHMSEEVKSQFNRFSAFAKEQLGERFIVLPATIRTGDHYNRDMARFRKNVEKALLQNSHFKLDRQGVKLNAFGEFQDFCVKNLGQATSRFLRSNNVNCRLSVKDVYSVSVEAVAKNFPSGLKATSFTAISWLMRTTSFPVDVSHIRAV